MNRNILVGCETSGTVREAFRALGRRAWSCDLEDSDVPSPHHIVADVVDVILDLDSKWGMVIAHPPCTHLAVSGAWMFERKIASGLQQQGVDLFLRVVAACEKMGVRYCIENPVGIMSRIWRKPDQIIQPYEFGDDASKKTCLWLHGLPPLKKQASQYFEPRTVFWNGKWRERWANQTDSGQNRLPPSEDRWKLRSKTYPGIAEAMAHQWASL